MEFVDQAFTKVLPDRVCPTTDPHVQSACRFARTVESLVNASRDEVERRAACHLDGGTGVMGEDEDRKVIRRVVPPPALPVHVRPRTTNRAEHIPSKDPGPDILEATRSEVIVNAGDFILIPSAQDFMMWSDVPSTDKNMVFFVGAESVNKCPSL